MISHYTHTATLALPHFNYTSGKIKAFIKSNSPPTLRWHICSQTVAEEKTNHANWSHFKFMVTTVSEPFKAAQTPSVFPYPSTLPSQPWHYWHFRHIDSLLWETVLCFVSCLAASLASTRQMPVTRPLPHRHQLWQPKMPPDTDLFFLTRRLGSTSPGFPLLTLSLDFSFSSKFLPLVTSSLIMAINIHTVTPLPYTYRQPPHTHI